MDRLLTLGGRDFVINNVKIRVESEFELSPNEVDKATSLLSLAGGMSNFAALPPEIENPPFTIEFAEDGNHSLIRDGISLNFSFEKLDELIDSLQMAQATAIDLQKIDPKTVPNFVGARVGDVFEGRD